MKIQSSRLRWRRPLLVALIGIIIICATQQLWLSWLGAWLVVRSDPQPADAIVDLGNSTTRADYAAELYRRGLAPQVWHTGDTPSTSQQPSTAQAMARRAMKRGVPAQATLVLASTSTWEDGQAIVAATHEHNVHSIIVVTDWYHSRRALCIIRQQLAGSDVVVFYAAPPNPAYGPESWWLNPYSRAAVLGEFLKFAAYWPLHGLDLRQC